MRCLRFTAPRQFEIAELPAPTPAPGEAVVALRAAALNHRDVWILHGQYGGLQWPCIPGSDGAGIVAAVGAGVDASWVGREVVINPSFGWGGDEAAQGPEFSILGLPRAGTLAERIAVPVAQLSPKPAHLDWTGAAAFPLAGLTAWRAVNRRARVAAGERVLITGIGGGVALFALQFALAAGAEVWVTSGSDEKLSRATALGARGGFNYTRADWAKRAAAEVPGGFHAIIDSAGGEGFESLVDLAAPGGRIVFFGATRGNPPVLPMRKIFWRQLTLLGTTMGSPGDWDAMVAEVGARRLVPVLAESFPLLRAGEALALMERGGQFGKIVVTLD